MAVNQWVLDESEVMEPLDGSVSTIRAPKSGRRTLVLVGLGAAVALTALGIGLRGRAGSGDGQTFVTDCKKVPGIPAAQVTWRRKPDGSAFAVEAVRAPNWAKSIDGWRLHHRPAGASPNDVFAENVQVSGDDVQSTWLERKALEWVPLHFPESRTLVTSLACPGGECLFSPVTGCKATYDYDRTGPKVAIIGDSLVFFDEVCGADGTLPPRPDFCSTPLAQRLRLRGMRVFSQSNAGQSFYAWLPVIREMAITEPNTFVLALGTNDALLRQAKAPEAERAQRRAETERAIRQSLRETWAISPKTCAVLVTVSGKGLRDEPKSHPDFVAETERVNTLFRNLAADPAHAGKIQLADFDKAAREHCGPEWLTADGNRCDWFQPDQLHLRGLGNEGRNALVLSAIERCNAAK